MLYGYADFPYAEFYYGECYYVECCCAECLYAESYKTGYCGAPETFNKSHMNYSCRF